MDDDEEKHISEQAADVAAPAVNGEEEATDLAKYIPPFRNEDMHSVYVRYGVPFFMVCTLVLLINAHVGSGVTADYILLLDGQVQEHKQLLHASIFTSVHKLWQNKTYALAIFIACTSISWPYLKLLIAFYAWFIPYQKPRRREFMIEIIDALGKWSFVDIVVFVEIMVAFRYVAYVGACRFVSSFGLLTHILFILSRCRSSILLTPSGKRSTREADHKRRKKNSRLPFRV